MKFLSKYGVPCMEIWFQDFKTFKYEAQEIRLILMEHFLQMHYILVGYMASDIYFWALIKIEYDKTYTDMLLLSNSTTISVKVASILMYS